MKLIYQHKRWLFPLLGLILLAPLTPYLDLKISGYFFHPEPGSFTNNAFHSFVYHYAQLPGFIFFGIVIVGLGLSYVKKNLVPHRNTLLVLVLAMALGPGLIINVFLKPGWGRPRPRQVVDFSGPEDYQAFYSPKFGYNGSDRYKSFPSGHASMGFYFFVLAVMGARMRNRSLVLIGYSVAISLGIILGITRVAQGGHFYSDIVIAALVTWWTALVVDWMIFSDCRENYSERFDRKTA